MKDMEPRQNKRILSNFDGTISSRRASADVSIFIALFLLERNVIQEDEISQLLQHVAPKCTRVLLDQQLQYFGRYVSPVARN